MSNGRPVALWKSWWIRATALVVLVCLAGFAWFVVGDRAKPAPSTASAPPPVASVGVRLANLKGVSQAFEFVGRIKAVEKVEVRARVEGFLERVLFREGQAREGQDVKSGDLLYQIEKVQFQAQVDQAKANLAAAQAEVTNARLQYARHLQLAKDQFSPQAQVDQDKAALDKSSAMVLQNRAALTQAEVNLDYTDIRSPIEGR